MWVKIFLTYIELLYSQIRAREKCDASYYCIHSTIVKGAKPGVRLISMLGAYCVTALGVLGALGVALGDKAGCEEQPEPSPLVLTLSPPPPTTPTPTTINPTTPTPTPDHQPNHHHTHTTASRSVAFSWNRSPSNSSGRSSTYRAHGRAPLTLPQNRLLQNFVIHHTMGTRSSPIAPMGTRGSVQGSG